MMCNAGRVTAWRVGYRGKNASISARICGVITGWAVVVAMNCVSRGPPLRRLEAGWHGWSVPKRLRVSKTVRRGSAIQFGGNDVQTSQHRDNVTHLMSLHQV